MTCTISVWAGPLSERETFKSTGVATGCGYHKLSGAVYDAFVRAGVTPLVVDHGNGLSAKEFTDRGYEVIQVLS